MVCIYCGADTQVVNSRLQKRANSVWRRRKCLQCGRMATTTEQVDYEKTWAVQAEDGSEQPFLREKLLLSLHKSCQHRPAALTDALGLTATVTSRLRGAAQDGNVTPTAIATICYEALQRFDKAAATMYRAYHEDVL